MDIRLVKVKDMDMWVVQYRDTPTGGWRTLKVYSSEKDARFAYREKELYLGYQVGIEFEILEERS